MRFREESPERLEIAIRKCTDECRYFPVFADLIRCLRPSQEELDAVQDELAERAWQDTLEWCCQNGNLPEGARIIGVLNYREKEALRVAGGANRVESCSKEELVWVRKLFIEAYLRQERIEAMDLMALPEEMQDALQGLARKKSLPQ